MKVTPPAIAIWMLEHWTPGDRNEALAGDLMEEFKSGRSVWWYWRQTVAAIAIGWMTELLKRRVLVVFAMLWSMPAPAWMLYTFRLEAHGHFIGRIWRIDWPWSTIFATSMHLAVNLGFIWAGILFYCALLAAITRDLRIQNIGRGLLRSVPVFIGTIALMVALDLLLAPVPAIDQRAVTLLSVATDMRFFSLLGRSPFFFTILFGVWGVRVRPRAILDKTI